MNECCCQQTCSSKVRPQQTAQVGAETETMKQQEELLLLGEDAVWSLKHIKTIVIEYKTVRSKAATTEYSLIIVLILIFELRSDVMMDYSSNAPLGANKTRQLRRMWVDVDAVWVDQHFICQESACVCVCVCVVTPWGRPVSRRQRSRIKTVGQWSVSLPRWMLLEESCVWWRTPSTSLLCRPPLQSFCPFSSYLSSFSRCL